MKVKKSEKEKILSLKEHSVFPVLICLPAARAAGIMKVKKSEKEKILSLKEHSVFLVLICLPAARVAGIMKVKKNQKRPLNEHSCSSGVCVL